MKRRLYRLAPLATAAKEDHDWWVQERAIEALGMLRINIGIGDALP